MRLEVGDDSSQCLLGGGTVAGSLWHDLDYARAGVAAREGDPCRLKTVHLGRP